MKDIVKNSVWNLRSQRHEKRWFRANKRYFRKKIRWAVYCAYITVQRHKETLKG